MLRVDEMAFVAGAETFVASEPDFWIHCLLWMASSILIDAGLNAHDIGSYGLKTQIIWDFALINWPLLVACSHRSINAF